MDRKDIHDLIDRLPESVIPDVRLALERLAMESNVRRYKEGQSVRLRNRDVVAMGVEIGQIGKVVEANPRLHPPRITVEFPNVTADVDPENLEEST